VKKNAGMNFTRNLKKWL